MVRICPECNEENEDTAQYCKNCGVNLVEVKNEKEDPADNQLVRQLFFWEDKYTHEYRLAKSKIIFEIIFLMGFVYGLIFYFFIYDVNPNFILAIFASIILGLIFSVPVFAVGYVIHRILEK